MNKFRPVKLGRERLDVIIFSSCAESSSKMTAHLEVLFRLLTPTLQSIYRHLKKKKENWKIVIESTKKTVSEESPSILGLQPKIMSLIVQEPTD